MSKLDILVLHCMGSEKKWFAGVADVELMFAKYDRTNNYLVHNCYVKIPDFVKDYQFDAILMMSTFMDNVAGSGFNGDWIKQFEFVKDSPAVKIVFPQDDYWFSEIKDQFYIDYKVDKVYPVCPESTWEELIPNYLQSRGRVQQGFTTYVTPQLLRNKQFNKKWTERSFDIVYRAKKIPTAPNRYGYIKGVIGERFLERVATSNLLSDISTDPKKLIHGDRWIDFLSSSRAILGSNSGSSVNLRNHAVRDRLVKYQAKNPRARWDEIEEMVFDSRDRGKKYTMVSPRNLEAATVGTLQVLTPGSYSGFMKPNSDFLLIQEDCSNADEIVESLKNYDLCLEKVDNCFRAIVNEPKLNSAELIKETIEFIRENSRRYLRETQSFLPVSERYAAQIEYRSYVQDLIILFKNFILSYMPTSCMQKIKKINNVVFRR